MPFPDDWPNDCPPPEADDALEEVLRIVKDNPPSPDDMMSHHEAGRLLKAPACLRCGLSVFRLIDDAINQQRLLPRLGRRIARARLDATHGKTCVTPGQQPTHTTWWPSVGVDRAALFVVVQEVT